jgi:hypothetical protein
MYVSFNTGIRSQDRSQPGATIIFTRVLLSYSVSFGGLHGNVDTRLVYGPYRGSCGFGFSFIMRNSALHAATYP